MVEGHMNRPDRITSYRDLKVWKRGFDLTERIYDLTSSFPAEEKFGLVDQLRRAAVSISSNIAEGWARNSPGAFGCFLKIANGSLDEIETQLIIAHRLRYIGEAARDELLEKIAVEREMLFALIQSLRKRS